MSASTTCGGQCIASSTSATSAPYMHQGRFFLMQDALMDIVGAFKYQTVRSHGIHNPKGRIHLPIKNAPVLPRTELLLTSFLQSAAYTSHYTSHWGRLFLHSVISLRALAISFVPGSAGRGQLRGDRGLPQCRQRPRPHGAEDRLRDGQGVAVGARSLGGRRKAPHVGAQTPRATVAAGNGPQRAERQGQVGGDQRRGVQVSPGETRCRMGCVAGDSRSGQPACLLLCPTDSLISCSTAVR